MNGGVIACRDSTLRGECSVNVERRTHAGRDAQWNAGEDWGLDFWIANANWKPWLWAFNFKPAFKPRLRLSAWLSGINVYLISTVRTVCHGSTWESKVRIIMAAQRDDITPYGWSPSNGTGTVILADRGFYANKNIEPHLAARCGSVVLLE